MAKILSPFHTKDGELQFPVQATRHIAYIWPTPPPTTIGALGIFELPEGIREDFQDGTGILLSIGPGYWGRDKKKLRWVPTPKDLVPGSLVFFDTSVPWKFQMKGLDGEMHKIVYCGFRDIHGLAL